MHASAMHSTTHTNQQQGRVATVQSLSGTGSLRLGAAFISRFMPGVTVYLPNPTWGNHKNIFADAGVKWSEYRYFDPETVGLDFAGMLDDLNNAPRGSVVILHGMTMTMPRILLMAQVVGLLVTMCICFWHAHRQ